MQDTTTNIQDIDQYFFPKRSSVNTEGDKISLACNYFRFENVVSNNQQFYKYTVDFTPSLPSDSNKLRIRLWSKARVELEGIVGPHMFNNTTLCCQKLVKDEFSVKILSKKEGGEEYTLSVRYTNEIQPNSSEAVSFYKNFFNQLLRKRKFVQIRRNYFEPKKAHILKDYGNLELWPGFNASVNIINKEIFLNINAIYKVLRQETALTVIQSFKKKSSKSEEFEQEVQEYFKNITVLTRYNNDKNYIITKVDFDRSPMSTFETKTGPISFVDYFNNKYGTIIKETSQPLLISIDKKRPDKEIALIPEMCYMTGLTDEMRANFNLMKEMGTITKGNALQKVQECKNMIVSMLEEEKCKEEVNKWGITLSNKPVEIKGLKLDVGNMLMAKQKGGNDRISFSIENSKDIDRAVQQEMYSQPAIKSFAVSL